MDVCQLIWNEYELVYGAYEDFNSHFLTLKGWSVTVALAAIIAVYSEKLGASGKVVLWIAALSSIPFWILDTIWKSYQTAYLSRLQYLEWLSDCNKLEKHELGTVGTWITAHGEFGLQDWMSFALNSAFPHVFVLIVGVVVILNFPPKANHIP